MNERGCHGGFSARQSDSVSKFQTAQQVLGNPSGATYGNARVGEEGNVRPCSRDGLGRLCQRDAGESIPLAVNELIVTLTFDPKDAFWNDLVTIGMDVHFAAPTCDVIGGHVLAPVPRPARCCCSAASEELSPRRQWWALRVSRGSAELGRDDLAGHAVSGLVPVPDAERRRRKRVQEYAMGIRVRRERNDQADDGDALARLQRLNPPVRVEQVVDAKPLHEGLPHARVGIDLRAIRQHRDPELGAEGPGIVP